MSINEPEREQAELLLRGVVTDLRSIIKKGDLGGSEMILGCRRILNLWMAAGGESLDDQAIGFTGIESQTDHVLGGSQMSYGRDGDQVRFVAGSNAEMAEIIELGRFFKEDFEREVEDLGRHLNV